MDASMLSIDFWHWHVSGQSSYDGEKSGRGRGARGIMVPRLPHQEMLDSNQQAKLVQWMRTSKGFLNKGLTLGRIKYHEKLLNIVTKLLNIVTIP